MDEDDIEKYEEIRSIASRNWLKPASVSLARLDQVKARVYNLNLTEQSQLHAHPGHVSSKPGVNGLHSKPPLASVPSQIHAWGSQASIPELIRKQSERQKQRPESAKHAHRTRPFSAKRPRPQSAKEPATTSPAVLQVYDLNELEPAAKPPMAVKGAKYDPNERPPEGLRTTHGTSTGWVAPPGGLCDVTLCDDDISNAIDSVTDEQGLLDDEETDSGIQSELGAAVEEVIKQRLSKSPLAPEETPPPKDHPPLLRRPTPAPIHFSLPTATMDPEPDDAISLDELLQATNDIDDDDDDENEDHTSLGPIIWQDPEEQEYQEEDEEEEEPEGCTSDVSPRERVSVSMPAVTHSDESEDEMVDLDKVDEELEEYERQRNKKHHENKRHTAHRVTIAEDRNQTLDITPRNVESAKYRSYIGRADLKNVQSRTDSGIKLQSEGSKQTNNKLDGRSTKVKSAVQKPRSRSQSPQPQNVPVAKVSVHIEDISDDEKEPPTDHHKKKKKILRKPPEVETMMSHLALSEMGQGDIMETKAISTGEKNYYDIAMTRPRSRSDGLIEEGVQRLKTVKTFQFSQDGVTEEKVVSELGVAAVPQKPVYTAPRPRSASRPSSAAHSQSPGTGTTKTPSGTNVQNKPPSAKPGHSKPLSGVKQEQPSEETGTTKNEENIMGEAERPGSRLGFIEDPNNKDVRNAPSGGQETGSEETGKTETRKALRRRRIWSAPPGRIQSAVGKVQSVKQRPISASAKPSTTMAVHVVAKPKLQEARRANAAAKALKHGDVTGGSRLYDNDRFYSNYSRAPPKPVGFAKKKLEAAKEVKPVEIWTRTGYCENPSEGIEACRDLQDQLLDSGVPVTLETLSRALLPPSDYSNCFNEYTVVNPRAKPFPSNTARLISKPMYWLPEEHKRVVQARKLVRMATQRLLEQEAEERRKMEEFEAKMSKKKRKKGKKKKGKSGKKKGKKSATKFESG